MGWHQVYKAAMKKAEGQEMGSCVPVHLVDERNPRNTVPTHLPVYRSRLTLHPCHGTEHQDSTVENTQCAFHFNSEVDVTYTRISNVL